MDDARTQPIDKAGKSYWDGVWATSARSGQSVSVVSGYRTRKQLEYFQREFTRFPARGREMLELGCARSEWLARFATDFGMRVAGLDYSEQGCEMAREVLRSRGIPGEIYCADMFHPPEALLNRFDYISSFGLVEHFEDLAGTLKATGQFLKPGGIAFTCIPNLAGLVGKCQKWLGPETYGLHIPWDREGLTRNLQASGFEVLTAEHIMLHDFAACEIDDSVSSGSRRLALNILKKFTLAAMIFESKTGIYPVNRQTAAYLYTTARKL